MSLRRSSRASKPVEKYVSQTSFSAPKEISPSAKENAPRRRNRQKKSPSPVKRKKASASTRKKDRSPLQRKKAASEEDGVESEVESAQDEEESDQEEDSSGPKFQRLFRDVMRISKPENAVTSWLRRYDMNEVVAMEELAAFMLYCCVGFDEEYDDPIEGVSGCMEDGIEEVIEKMNAIGDAAVFYPLVINPKGPQLKQYKNFGRRLETFWKAFLSCIVARDDAEQTQDILAQTLSWLTSISSAKNRALRHTATFSALVLAKAQAQQCGAVLRQLHVNKKRLKAERRGSSASASKKAKAALPRVRKLEASVAADKAKIADTNKAMESVFTGIFMHRAQDVDARIREEVVQRFADLVVAYKEYFLSEKYLQHFLYSIEDKEPRVRVAGVSAVSRIFHSADEEEFESLEMFRDRFNDKAADRFTDVVPGMINAVLDLCFELDAKAQLPQEFLDAAVSCILLHDSNTKERSVGPAAQRRAAQLVIEYNEDLRSASKAQQLSAFVRFCSTQTTRSTVGNCDLLVAAFFRIVPVLKDFGPIVARLLEDKDEGSEHDVAIALRVLYASAKHAKNLKDKPKASKSKQEHYHSVLAGFTTATVASYDKLVTRFGSEAEFAPIIFELPQLMVADAFAAAANPFKRMCKSLKTCFLKATDVLTLQPIAASLASLQNACRDVAPREHAEVQATMASLAQALDSAISPVLEEFTARGGAGKPTASKSKKGAALEMDSVTNLGAVLRRLKSLFMHTDLRSEISDQTEFVAQLYSFVEATSQNITTTSGAEAVANNLLVAAAQAASEALTTAHFWFMHDWVETFEKLCSLGAANESRQTTSTEFQMTVDAFVAAREPYVVAMRLIVELDMPDIDEEGAEGSSNETTELRDHLLKLLQRQAWKQINEVWLANNQSVSTDHSLCHPLRFPYADDQEFIATLANVFTDWMEDLPEDECLEDDLADPSNGVTGNGCDNGPASRFDAIKTLAQVLQANPGANPTLQGGVLFAQYASASKNERELIKKISRRWAHGSAHDHVQLIKCQVSALRHKFGIFRACMSESDEAMRSSYTALIELAQKLSKIVVGFGKVTNLPQSLKDAYNSFLEDGVRFAFGQVNSSGVASLYYVDVIDEYVPRLDAEMLEQFRSFVEAEAQAHGIIDMYTEAVKDVAEDTSNGIWKAFSDFMEHVGIELNTGGGRKTNKKHTAKARKGKRGKTTKKSLKSRRGKKRDEEESDIENDGDDSDVDGDDESEDAAPTASVVTKRKAKRNARARGQPQSKSSGSRTRSRPRATRRPLQLDGLSSEEEIEQSEDDAEANARSTPSSRHTAKPQKRRVHSLEDSDNDVADEAIESASDNDDNASSAEEDPIENTQKDKPAARKRSRRTRR